MRKSIDQLIIDGNGSGNGRYFIVYHITVKVGASGMLRLIVIEDGIISRV